MRIGLGASFITHVALIGFGLVSLSNAKPHRPEIIESISIDLIPIEDITNIRVGTEQSEIIEAEVPSPINSPEVATLGERAGNTEQDQPNPKDAEIESPAPAIQTAPAPQAEPADEPIKQDEPEPTVETEPEPPQQDIDPELATQAQPDSEPQQIIPTPIIRTASLDQKRAEFKKQQEQEQREKQELAKKQKEEAQEADKVADIINKEESRGATTGTGGQASIGRPTGQAARLSRSEKDALAAAMRKCWNPPISALSEEGLTIRLLVDLKKDGSVSGTPKILSQISTSIEKSTARAAQRAVLRCSPYKLSAQKYDDWKQVDVTFDPRDIQ